MTVHDPFALPLTDDNTRSLRRLWDLGRSDSVPHPKTRPDGLTRAVAALPPSPSLKRFGAH